MPAPSWVGAGPRPSCLTPRRGPRHRQPGQARAAPHLRENGRSLSTDPEVQPWRRTGDRCRPTRKCSPGAPARRPGLVHASRWRPEAGGLFRKIGRGAPSFDVPRFGRALLASRRGVWKQPAQVGPHNAALQQLPSSSSVGLGRPEILMRTENIRAAHRGGSSRPSEPAARLPAQPFSDAAFADDVGIRVKPALESERPFDRQGHGRRGWVVPTLIGSTAALAAAALYNIEQARDAERRHPPLGRFITVDGVRLHYIERGQGEPLLLLHGNGTMIQDFTSSGLVERLADRYRVIVVDRPGYGYSSRPRGLWTPRAYATLFEKALRRLGVEQVIVLGHSWGTMVAVALALQAPGLVRSLVLASGYYYPTLRADTFLLSPPAIPVLGDVMRYTIAPLVAKAVRPAMIRRVFAPAPVPDRFEREFPKSLMVRPLQLRAAAEDAALMPPSVIELQKHYRGLHLPIVIIAGADDKIADLGRQSGRLHQELPGSEFVVLPGLGHMVHHLAPDQVVRAVELAGRPASSPSAGA